MAASTGAPSSTLTPSICRLNNGSCGPRGVALYNYAHQPAVFAPQRRIPDADLPLPEVKVELLSLHGLRPQSWERAGRGAIFARNIGRFHGSPETVLRCMSAEAVTSGVESLSRAVLTFLRRYPPFDQMEEEALRFLTERLFIGYHAKGARILAPGEGEPEFLYVIRSGVVQLAPADNCLLPSGVESTLGPGECFPVGALLERRPVTSAHVAATDAFCYQLAAADFRELLRRSPRFQAFSTRYLGSLLSESRRLLKMHHASLAAEQQAMGRTLRSLIQRPAVTCTSDTPIGAALRSMQQARIGSIVVAAPGGAPVGIFTRYDVLERVALFGRSLDEPISAVMTPAPRVLPAEANAYDAALLIAQHGIRHVPVVDGGRLIGVITERDLFALQRSSIRSIQRTVAGASEGAQLQQAALNIRHLARDLIGEGTAAEHLIVIISTLNDALTRRIVGLEQVHHGIAGIDWSWLGFGSEGRYEQTIATDQDNGLIFLAPPGETADAVRQRLLPFAQAVNRTLAACGYPLCSGNIMAGNPMWCLTLDEWRRRFDDWINNTDPQALLNASIFFDFRAICGREELAQTLREALLARAAGAPRFLRQMAEQAVAVRPPLGILSDFVTDDTGDGPGLDLKTSAARLFVDAARVIALTAAVAHTSTAERLRQGGTKLGMSADEVGSAVEAFFFVQMLRLRRQAAGNGDSRRAAYNRIDPTELNEVDRRMLKECLRQVRKLQRRLALDHQL